MNSINDLKKTSMDETVHESELSQIKDDQQPSQSSIVINPRRKVRHRSTESTDGLQTVNPSQFIEKPAPKKVETIESRAFDALDRAVERKRNEFKEWQAMALEEDKLNREKVENGLEVVEDELQYLPDNLHQPMDDSERVISNAEKAAQLENDIEAEIELDHSDDSDTFGEMETETDSGQIVVKKPKFMEDESEETIIETPELEIPNQVVMNTIDTPVSSDDFNIDDEDIQEVEDEMDVSSNDEELSREEIMKISEAAEKNLKSDILKKLINTGKTLNTSQFVVSNKVISMSDALRHIPNRNAERVAIWPLLQANRPYKASALKGPEVALLADEDTSQEVRNIGLSMTQVKILFEHDANPYRPKSVEQWAKTIPFTDIENIFAALYVASLRGSNYVPLACPKQSCQHAYLSENLEIDSMLKFDNDAAKKRFETIKSMELTAKQSESYESILNVINDKFAVTIKIPSVFTMLYEYNTLDQDFKNKYKTMSAIIQYIDRIMYIDKDSSQFVPIGWKTYPGDYSKSFKSKIVTYAKILKEFNDVDFNLLMSLINSLINDALESRNVHFEIPETKCPKCKSTIPAREINARGLVFMRQRLVELATTPSRK
nr:MAG TPA: hypothetical protein [Caudoviricetes sp.]